MTVVELVEKDIPTCARIVEETPLLWRYGYCGAAAARDISGALTRADDLLLGVRIDSQLAGFAWVVSRRCLPEGGYLRLIALQRSMTSKGLGAALLGEAERRVSGGAGFGLLVSSANDPARRFYERQDYRCLGYVADYVRVGLCEHYYWKALQGSSGAPVWRAITRLCGTGAVADAARLEVAGPCRVHVLSDPATGRSASEPDAVVVERGAFDRSGFLLAARGPESSGDRGFVTTLDRARAHPASRHGLFAVLPSSADKALTLSAMAGFELVGQLPDAVEGRPASLIYARASASRADAGTGCSR